MLPSSFRRAVTGSVGHVTVFLFKTSYSLFEAAVLPYVVIAVCSDLYYYRGGDDDGSSFAGGEGDYFTNASFNGSDEACYVPGALPEQLEIQVHRYASAAVIVYQVLNSVPGVILGLYCGAWSDSRGRKLPMAAPCVGACLAVGFFLASVHVTRVKVVLWLAGALTQGSLGSNLLLLNAVSCHVADTSQPEQRTNRLGHLLACTLLGKFLGSLLAGALQDSVSLTATLIVPLAGFLACILIIAVGVADPAAAGVTRAEGGNGRRVGRGKTEDGGGEKGAEERKQPALFSLAGLKDSLRTVTKRREGSRRSVIVIALVVIALNQGVRCGVDNVTVLFVKQPPLSWPSSRYGYLVAVTQCVMGISLLLVLPLLSRVLGVSDSNLALTAVVSWLVRILWSGFCTETWMMFAAMACGGLTSFLIPVLQSLSCRAVGADEMGKVFFLQASLEKFFKLVGTGVFTGVYAATVQVRPGAAFLAAAAVCLVMLGLVLRVRRAARNDRADVAALTFDPRALEEAGEEEESALLRDGKDGDARREARMTYSSVPRPGDAGVSGP